MQTGFCLQFIFFQVDSTKNLKCLFIHIHVYSKQYRKVILLEDTY